MLLTNFKPMHAKPHSKPLQFAQIAAGTSGILQMSMVLLTLATLGTSVAWLGKLVFKETLIQWG
jgi:hypothetical protein